MHTILICIDHKWRDLAGYVYVKKLLEKEGYRVILVRNNFEEYYADVYNPQAVIMIHLYDKKVSDRAKRMKNRGIRIFLMPTEGIPTLKSIRAFSVGAFSDLSAVDLQFLWSDEMKKEMLSYNVIDASKIRVVGVPRFDFYKQPLVNILLTKDQLCEKYNLDSSLPIITWATNFTHASFFVKNKDFLKKDWKKYKLDKIYDPEQIPKRDYESREIIFSSIMRLINEIDNVNLIIKLHPSEDHLYYYDRIEKLNSQIKKRIKIITKEYIWDVLNSTDVLIKRSCTTGIEAWILKKPTIELKLNPDEWYFSEEHARGSDIVNTYDELKDKVLFYLKEGAIPDDIMRNREDFLRKWCYKTDGKSTKRFVSAMLDFLRKDGAVVAKQRKIIEKIKSLLIVFLMNITDYRLHDIKIYGLFKKVDKLGRIDKFFHNKDTGYWEKRLKNIYV